MSRRSRIVGFGSAGVLVVAGIACAFAFSGSLGQNLAFVLVALGLVLATSLVFYEVGLTEDRERRVSDEAAGGRMRAGASATTPPSPGIPRSGRAASGSTGCAAGRDVSGSLCESRFTLNPWTPLAMS